MSQKMSQKMSQNEERYKKSPFFIVFDGWIGKFEYDHQSEIYHGEVLGINDVVDFCGDLINELRTEFVNSVNEYIDFCKLLNKEPEKPEWMVINNEM